MHRQKNKIVTACIICFVSLIILVLILLKWGYPEFSKMAQGIPESESFSERETESSEAGENITESQTELQTEIEIETEPDSEISDPAEETLSYLEQCALDYVEPPVVRTREEALEKIKELSKQYPILHSIYNNQEQYGNSLILALAGNPEMADFAYGYLTREPVVTGGFTEDEIPEEYPLFLQWDIRWGYMPYGNTGGNMGSSGCGPACLSMAIFYLTGNRECTPDAVATYSMEHGYYVAGAGTAWSLLTDYPKKLGLSSVKVGKSEARLKAELDKGNILICSVRPGDFTSGGHFIVIYGYDENGFKVNDPKCVYRSRLSWTYEQIQDDIKQTWSIGH